MRILRFIKLFLSLVWEEDPLGGIITVSTTWEVAKIIHGKD